MAARAGVPSDEIGEFAQAVAALDDFPDSGGKAIFDGYFESESDDRRQTYERAWAEFEASPEPSLP